MKRSRGNKFWCLWQASNEINYPNNRLGWNDTLYRRLYSTIKKTRTGLIDPERKSKRGLFSNTSSSHSLSSYSSPLTLNSSSSSSLSSSVTTSSNSHGGIFNLSFTPDGSLLLAATEGKAILAYDPFTHQLVKTVPNAHDAALNYIKFLGISKILIAVMADDIEFNFLPFLLHSSLCLLHVLSLPCLYISFLLSSSFITFTQFLSTFFIHSPLSWFTFSFLS